MVLINSLFSNNPYLLACDKVLKYPHFFMPSSQICHYNFNPPMLSASPDLKKMEWVDPGD